MSSEGGSEHVVEYHQEGGESKILGMTTGNWVKLLGIIFVLWIIVSIAAAFKGIANTPGLQNLADVFNNVTGALAFASSHWYLVLAAFLLAPLLPSTYKYVAGKMGDALKTPGQKAEVLERVSDALTYQAAQLSKSDTSISNEKRLEIEAKGAEAADRYNKQSDEQREESDKALEKIGVDPPPRVKVAAMPQLVNLPTVQRSQASAPRNGTMQWSTPWYPSAILPRSGGC